MQLTEKQSELLNRRKIVVLATSSKEGNPRAIFVEANRVDSDKIIITDNEMKGTRNNFLENKNVFILAFENDYSYCLKIKGEVKYCTEGEDFNFVKSCDSNKNRSPRGVLVVNSKEIKEFK